MSTSTSNSSQPVKQCLLPPPEALVVALSTICCLASLKLGWSPWLLNFMALRPFHIHLVNRIEVSLVRQWSRFSLSERLAVRFFVRLADTWCSLYIYIMNRKNRSNSFATWAEQGYEALFHQWSRFLLRELLLFADSMSMRVAIEIKKLWLYWI